MVSAAAPPSDGAHGTRWLSQWFPPSLLDHRPPTDDDVTPGPVNPRCMSRTMRPSLASSYPVLFPWGAPESADRGRASFVQVLEPTAARQRLGCCVGLGALRSSERA